MSQKTSVKKCPKCDIEKSHDDFGRNKARKDGLQGWCKGCCNAWHSSPVGRAANRRAVSKYEKSGRSRAKDLRYDRSEKGKAKYRRYLQSDKGKASIRIRKMRRRDREASLDCDYSIEDREYTFELFDNRCFKCNTGARLEIDHNYPLSDGGVLSRYNAVILCKSCNTSKGNKRPEQFYTRDELEQLVELLTSGLAV